MYLLRTPRTKSKQWRAKQRQAIEMLWTNSALVWRYQFLWTTPWSTVEQTSLFQARAATLFCKILEAFDSFGWESWVDHFFLHLLVSLCIENKPSDRTTISRTRTSQISITWQSSFYPGWVCHFLWISVCWRSWACRGGRPRPNSIRR